MNKSVQNSIYLNPKGGWNRGLARFFRLLWAPILLTLVAQVVVWKFSLHGFMAIRCWPFLMRHAFPRLRCAHRPCRFEKHDDMSKQLLSALMSERLHGPRSHFPGDPGNDEILVYEGHVGL